MKKKYKIKQYSTINPNIDLSLLSIEQIKLRLAELEPEYKGEMRRCKICAKDQPITEYYPKYTDKEHKIIKRRSRTCRDCELRQAGVKEVGKQRFSDKLLTKYFRRCSICKEIKPLFEYKKSKNSYGGFSNCCYPCQHKLHQKYIKKQQTEIGDFYIREWGYKHGILRGAKIDAETHARLKSEIIEYRKPNYFVDSREFFTVVEFAQYINNIYKIPTDTIKKRISNGAAEQDCKIPEYYYRGLKHSKEGQIQVIDTITREEFIFCNTKHPKLLAMFSTSARDLSIKTGRPTRITSLSKYKNPCIIKRI